VYRQLERLGRGFAVFTVLVARGHRSNG